MDKCLKRPVSEEPSTSNMVNGPKHCLELNDTAFTILIHPCEDNAGLKVFLNDMQNLWTFG